MAKSFAVIFLETLTKCKDTYFTELWESASVTKVTRYILFFLYCFRKCSSKFMTINCWNKHNKHFLHSDLIYLKLMFYPLILSYVVWVYVSYVCICIHLWYEICNVYICIRVYVCAYVYIYKYIHRSVYTVTFVDIWFD